MITPAQSRSARALLDWSREQLAEQSEVALRTIVDFERGAREPRKITLLALKSALERSGIEFINTPEREGVVRLRKTDSGNLW